MAAFSARLRSARATSLGRHFTITGCGASASAVVCALEVLDSDEVMIVTASGKVTRAAAAAVPVQGRRTQGRRVVTLAKGDRVVEVTRADGGSGVPAREVALVGEQAELDL